MKQTPYWVASTLNLSQALTIQPPNLDLVPVDPATSKNTAKTDYAKIRQLKRIMPKLHTAKTNYAKITQS